MSYFPLEIEQKEGLKGLKCICFDLPDDIDINVNKNALPTLQTIADSFIRCHTGIIFGLPLSAPCFGICTLSQYGIIPLSFAWVQTMWWYVLGTYVCYTSTCYLLVCLCLSNDPII